MVNGVLGAEVNLNRVLSVVALGYLLLGCGEKEECVASVVESCPVTFNIDYVCGCDNVTYVNPSEAECHQIYSYEAGECSE